MSEKPCILCSHHEYAANKYKSRAERLNWILYNLKDHLVESMQIDVNVDAEKMLEFIDKKINEIE